MAVDGQDELPEATLREAELQRQLDGIQSQVTELNRVRVEVSGAKQSSSRSYGESRALFRSPELEGEARQTLQATGAERLTRSVNSGPRFGPLPTRETPNYGTGVNLPQGDAATREKAKGAQTYDVEDSESEPEPDKEAPEGVAKTKSPMVAYLEQMFSKRVDAM
ncbi:hypothetical protein F2Q69_00058470 [Brassica cretica]|uniref:Uncharacterized protein n=1 Tax=Brassica cretica TaxID=69181 RepID=A0A8S9RQJ1_BRACR|nr:hypothetical protein F2Q69_00058470 [Brassica cretica]